jgi:prophage regulatory protein
MPNAIRIIRRVQVQSLTGLSRSTIYAGIASGNFPRPVPLGPRAVGWIEDEVNEWVTSRIAARKQSVTIQDRAA